MGGFSPAGVSAGAASLVAGVGGTEGGAGGVSVVEGAAVICGPAKQAETIRMEKTTAPAVSVPTPAGLRMEAIRFGIGRVAMAVIWGYRATNCRDGFDEGTVKFWEEWVAGTPQLR